MITDEEKIVTGSSINQPGQTYKKVLDLNDELENSDEYEYYDEEEDEQGQPRLNLDSSKS